MSSEVDQKASSDWHALEPLLPCPFCGVSLEMSGQIVQYLRHPLRSIEEAHCPGAQVAIEFAPEPDHHRAAMWNRRSASPSIGRVGEDAARALGLLAAEDERNDKIHDLLETIREQIRLEVAPEHRPDGLMKNIQNAVYAMRGRMRLMNDAAITSPLSALVYHEEPAGDTQGAGWVNQVHPKQKCPACQGTGDIGGNPSYGPCPDCGGSGKVSAALVSPPDNGEAAETQESIGAWADKTFGVVTDLPRAVGRAGEELAELKEAAETLTPQDMIVEMADVVIVLMRLANVIGQDLTAAINAKMAINRKRVWKTDGTGHGYHVKQSALQSHNEGSAGK